VLTWAHMAWKWTSAPFFFCTSGKETVENLRISPKKLAPCQEMRIKRKQTVSSAGCKVRVPNAGFLLASMSSYCQFRPIECSYSQSVSVLVPQDKIRGSAIQFLEPVNHWSRSAAISEVSHWLQCIQVRADSRSRFLLRFYSFSCGEEAGSREILRLSRRTLENRRKLQRTERMGCAIAGGVDTLCKDRAGKGPVGDLLANQGPPFQAGTVPFRVDEDRIGGSAIVHENTNPSRQKRHCRATTCRAAAEGLFLEGGVGVSRPITPCRDASQGGLEKIASFHLGSMNL